MVLFEGDVVGLLSGLTAGFGRTVICCGGRIATSEINTAESACNIEDDIRKLDPRYSGASLEKEAVIRDLL